MSQQLNPDDFVITRRRKKYKFAKFANADNCFEYDEWSKQPVDVLEIGAGTGLFSVELAARYPDKSFVALDVKADRLQKGAYAAIERHLSNVLFVRARADQIDELFEPASMTDIWVTFADPFPRMRSAGRRLTHPSFLAKYQKILSPNGTLHIKHDNPDFFAWTLEQLVAGKWTITELVFDVHDSDTPRDAHIMTTYEQRWLDEGRRTSYVAAQPPANSSTR